MSKASASFTRRTPDIITEELAAALSSKASFEFKALFDVILVSLRERNAASGGGEKLRVRAYEKIQGLVGQGVVTRRVNGIVKKYKGVAPRLVKLTAELEIVRSAWNKKVRDKATAAAAAAKS